MQSNTLTNKDFTSIFNDFVQDEDFPVQLDSIPIDETKLTGVNLGGYGEVTDSAHKGKIFLHIQYPYKDKSIPKIFCFSHKEGGIRVTFDGRNIDPNNLPTLSDEEIARRAALSEQSKQASIAAEERKKKKFKQIGKHLTTKQSSYQSVYWKNKGFDTCPLIRFDDLELSLQDKNGKNQTAQRRGLGAFILDARDLETIIGCQLLIDRYKRYDKNNEVIDSSYGATANSWYVDTPKINYGVLKGGVVPCGNNALTDYKPVNGEIYVCEGLATAYSIVAANPQASVFAALSASNIPHAVSGLIEGFKGQGLKRIIICADNDLQKYTARIEQAKSDKKEINDFNAGLFYAVAAYKEHHGQNDIEINICTIPNALAMEGITDFNDLAVSKKDVLPINLMDYIIPVDFIENPLNYCSSEKAKNFFNNESLQLAAARPTHEKNLYAYFNEMGTFTSKILVNKKHLSDGVDTGKLLDTKGLIFIKAPMGTGKTVFIREYFKVLQQRGETGVYLCPSRALTRQMRDSLRQDGLTVFHYKDANDNLNLTQLCDFVGITTINSVWRFDGIKPHTVIIDESEQLLPVITSSIIEYPQSTSDILTKLCENAHNVIVLDAQMSKFSVETMQRIKPDVDSLLIHNTFQTAKDKRVTMLQTKGEFWAKFDELLKAGKKIYVSTTSKQEARALSEFVKHRYPTIACLTLVANDNDDITLLGTLENINNEVLKYDVVITSPVVSSGVSIDVNHFDVGMGYYLPHMQQTPSLVTAVQQLGRVRKVKELYVFFQDRQSSKLEIDPAKLLEYKKQELHLLVKRKQVVDDATGAVTTVPTYPNHVLLDYENKAKQNLLDRHQKESFLFLLREEGYQVTIEPENSALSEYGLILREEACAVSKANYHHVIATAPEIPIEQASALKAKNLKTKEEYAAIPKAKACDFMGIESKDFNASHSELWASGLQSKINHLELLKTHDDLVASRDIETYLSAVDKSTEYTTFESLKSRKWIDSVVLSAFFDSEGNHYPDVCNTSPSVIKARDTLLSNKDLLKLRRINVGQLSIKPLKVINEKMRDMGFDVRGKQVRIDGKPVRYYTATLNPDIARVLQQREHIGLSKHLDNPVSMFAGCEQQTNSLASPINEFICENPIEFERDYNVDCDQDITPDIDFYNVSEPDCNKGTEKYFIRE